MKTTLAVILSVSIAFVNAKDKEGLEQRTITTTRGDRLTFNSKERLANVVNEKICKTIIVNDDKPVTLNGKLIFYFKDHKDLVFGTTDIERWNNDRKQLDEAIAAALEQEKKQLPPGNYEFKLNNMVVNEQGKIVYYTTGGFIGHKLDSRVVMVKGDPRTMYFPKKNTPQIDLTESITRSIEDKIVSVLNSYAYTPFVYSGEPTPYLGAYSYSFVVNDKELTPDQLFEELKRQGSASK